MEPNSKTTTGDALLGMLTMGPANGYEIKLRIERTIGNFWNESFGQIYPTLKRLEQMGLIESRTERRAKIYSITAAGREHIRDWLEIPPKPLAPRNELLLKVFFGVLASPESLRSHVRQTRERYAADLERYNGYRPIVEAKFAGNPGLPFWFMPLSYGQREARMIIDWCDETLALLDRQIAAVAHSNCETRP